MIASSEPRLPAATTMGAVGLVVSDLNRSLAYYTASIGLRVHSRTETQARLGVGGPALLVLTEQPGARPVQRGRSGLYHFALVVPTRADLARTLRHLVDAHTPLTGAADHWVSEALYMNDPDGHGIEIYRDRPRADWPLQGGQLQMGTDPLDVDGVMAEIAGASYLWTGLAAGAHMGHVHLHVGELREAEHFYGDLLGFDLMLAYGSQALFFSAGGYHHHVGFNLWAGRGAPPPSDDAARLNWFEIRLPTDEAYAEVIARLRMAQVDLDDTLGVATLYDPSRNRVRLLAAHMESLA